MRKEKVFELGRIIATPGALKALEEAGQEAGAFLCRHQAGDWGELFEEDKAANDRALLPETKGRLMSAYRTTKGEKLWIITEWDRSVTTILVAGGVLTFAKGRRTDRWDSTML